MLLAVLFGRGIAHLPGFLVSLQLTSLHYAQTLAHWAEPFALARERVRQAYGDEFQRAWELYLAGSQAAFATGWMQLVQILFTPARVGAPVVDARRSTRGAASHRMIRCDALVVGGGPGGSTCARVLQSHDFNEHVKQCAAFLERSGALTDTSNLTWRGHAYLASGMGPRPIIGDGLLLIGDGVGLACPESGEGIRPPRPLRAALAAAGRLLLGSPSFTRHVVLDRGFLRRLPERAWSLVCSRCGGG